MHRFALSVLTFPLLLAAAQAQQSVVLDGPFEPSLGSAYDSSRDRLVLFGLDGRTRELADDRLLTRMARSEERRVGKECRARGTSETYNRMMTLPTTITQPSHADA